MSSVKVVQQEVPAGNLALFDNSLWLGCHWIVALLLAAGWMIVGAQVMLIETVHAAFAGTTYLYGIATYLLGTIPGALLFGSLADRIGRKPVYTATAFIYMTTGFATALLPPDLYGFAALRFLVGAAAGADYVVLNTMLQEIMPKRSRGWACLAVNSTFWLGLAAVELISRLPGGTGAIIERWQTVFWTVGVLGAVLLGLRWFLPESPRWLIAHCRKDRQTDSMLNEIRRDLASRDKLPAATGLRLMAPVRVPGLSLAGLLWREYRRQTLVCLALICSQAFFYNAFSFRFSAMLQVFYGGVEGPIASNLIYYIAAANFAGPLLLGRWFDKAGRKTMIWASYMISGCLMLWVSALLLLDYLPRGSVEMTIVWAVIFFFASTAASSAYLTLGESFPAEIRATAFHYFLPIR
jgi:MFS family permease